MERKGFLVLLNKLEAEDVLIVTKLEQYDYAGATAIAMVMLLVSFVLLLTINLLQAWTRKRGQAERT
jgi:sulfate transport system permease protein